MESHEIPIYVTTPCYIVALEGYTVDQASGQPVYDEKLQFVAQNVGATEEPAVVIFSNRRFAEDYIKHLGEELPLRALEFSNDDSFKNFLGVATAVYRVVCIDPDPDNGTMRAAVPIEDVLQNLDFPGVTGL
jgi:hypothetical protein